LSDQHLDSEAIEEYKRVVELDSSYQSVYYNMGVAQARLKLYDDALASLLKQREYADDLDTENLLAAVYADKGMQSKAAEARQKAEQFRASR